MIKVNSEIPFGRMKDVMAVLQAALDAQPFQNPIDMKGSAMICAGAMASDGATAVMVSETEDERLDGILIGVLARNPIDGLTVAQAQLVHAEKPGAFQGLSDRFYAWARGKGAAEVFVGLPSNIRLDGFTLTQSVYGKKVEV